MQLTVNSQLLAQELRALDKVVSAKSTIPILSHILLTATDALRLSATDLEVALMTHCKAEITEQGTITLPSKKLLDLVEQLPNADVTMLLSKGHVYITCGAFKSRLQTLDAKDFPPLPNVTGDVAVIAGGVMRYLIDHTLYAVPESSQKYLLNGALLTLTDTAIAMVATDGKRIAVATSSHGGGTMDPITIPTKTLNVLSSLGTTYDVVFSHSDRHLFFVVNDRVLVSRMLEGKFPAYSRSIPRNSDKQVVVDRVAFTAALKRVSLMSDTTQAVYLAIDKHTLAITSSSAEVGDADERLIVQYEGDPLKVYVNSTHVLDFLNAANEGAVTLHATDEKSPLMFTDGASFLNVIMVMRS